MPLSNNFLTTYNLTIEQVLYALYDYACKKLEAERGDYDQLGMRAVINPFLIEAAVAAAAQRGFHFGGDIFLGVYCLDLNVCLADLQKIDVSHYNGNLEYGLAMDHNAGLSAIQRYIGENQHHNPFPDKPYAVEFYAEPAVAFSTSGTFARQSSPDRPASWRARLSSGSFSFVPLWTGRNNTEGPTTPNTIASASGASETSVPTTSPQQPAMSPIARTKKPRSRRTLSLTLNLNG